LHLSNDYNALISSPLPRSYLLTVPPICGPRNCCICCLNQDKIRLIERSSRKRYVIYFLYMAIYFLVLDFLLCNSPYSIVLVTFYTLSHRVQFTYISYLLIIMFPVGQQLACLHTLTCTCHCVCCTVCPDNCQLCSYGGEDSTDKIVPVGTIRCHSCNVGYHYTSPTECSG